MPIHVPVAVHVARHVFTRARRVVAVIDRARSLIVTGYRVTANTTASRSAQLVAITIRCVLTQAVIGCRAAATNLEITSVDGAIHTVVTLGVLQAASPEGRFDGFAARPKFIVGDDRVARRGCIGQGRLGCARVRKWSVRNARLASCDAASRR
jgi:hypothetical protein